jgi:hypothetical protein
VQNQKHTPATAAILTLVALVAVACAPSAPLAPATPSEQATAIPQPAAPFKFPQVRLARDGDRFKFLIDNAPHKLLGINYNVDYSQLPVSGQRRHDQDFQLLAAHGFKVVSGWGIFNETTLQSADKHDIKVIMPIELDPTNVYANPRFRDDAFQKLINIVSRFQDSPAVIMWNPGGDEFLAYLEENLVARQVVEERQNIMLQDTANLLVEMAQLAYRIDKHKRPSVIKQVKIGMWKILPNHLSSASVWRGPECLRCLWRGYLWWPDHIAQSFHEWKLQSSVLGWHG